MIPDLEISLHMIGDRVLVKAENQQEHTTPKGVIVVESYAPEVLGTVISCGDNLDVKRGDIVLFTKESGTSMELQGSHYLVLKESEILAVWDEEQNPA